MKEISNKSTISDEKLLQKTVFLKVSRLFTFNLVMTGLEPAILRPMNLMP